MPTSFRRPRGAALDRFELEYVSALHQTQQATDDSSSKNNAAGGGGGARRDGSIRAVDVQIFLRSRYGVEVSEEDVERHVICGFGHGGGGGGGGDKGQNEEDDDGEDDGSGDGNGNGSGDGNGDGGFLDLAELTALLLVPTLVKADEARHGKFRDQWRPPPPPRSGDGEHETTNNGAAADGIGEGEGSSDAAPKPPQLPLLPPRGMIERVLEMILRDANVNTTPRRRGGRATAPEVTPLLMKRILETYGEDDLARDNNLLREMSEAAAQNESGRSGGAVLNAEAFSRALTCDVIDLSDSGAEVRATTSFRDVVATPVSRKPVSEVTFDADDDANDLDEGYEEFRDDDEGGVARRKTRPSYFQSAFGGANANAIKALSTKAITKGLSTKAMHHHHHNTSPGADDDNDHDCGGSLEPRLRKGHGVPLRTFFSSPALDHPSVRYDSKLLLVLLYVAFILNFFAYWFVDPFGSVRDDDDVCLAEAEAVSWTEVDFPDRLALLGCWVKEALLRSVIYLATLAMLGLVFIGFGSIWNGVADRKAQQTKKNAAASSSCLGSGWWRLVLRAAAVMVQVGLAVFSWIFATNVNGKFLGDYDLHSLAVVIMTAVSLTLVALLQVWLLFGVGSKNWFVRCWAERSDAWSLSNADHTEAGLKAVASRRVIRLCKNALVIHGRGGASSSSPGYAGGSKGGARKYSNGGGGGRGGGGDPTARTTSFAAGLMNFEIKSEEYDTIGGFVWGWRKFLDDELFRKEGIFVSARVLAGNVVQLLLAAVLVFGGISATELVVDWWREGREAPLRPVFAAARLLFRLNLEGVAGKEVVERYCETHADSVSWAHEDIYAGSVVVAPVTPHLGEYGYDNTPMPTPNADDHTALGIDVTSASSYPCGSFVQSAIVAALERVANDLYPWEEYMIWAPMAVMIVVSSSTALAYALCYIPSVAATTLQFRSGVIPLFHDEASFAEHRTAVGSTYIIFGSMIWASIYSSIALGVLLGGFIFLCLWQATQLLLASLLASFVGLFGTLALGLFVASFLLRAAYAGFYRTRVNRANLIALATESIVAGFGIGVSVTRFVKLALVSLFYIGRVDRQLHAPGIGFGPLVDRQPLVFRREILAQEAHRHPFLEILGKLYLTKLRHGDDFGNRAGYCYRLIFTIALMPWLRKYRVMARRHLTECKELVRRGSTISHVGLDQSIAAPSWDRSVSLDHTLDQRPSLDLSSKCSSPYRPVSNVTVPHEEEEIESRNDILEENGRMRGELAVMGAELDELRRFHARPSQSHKNARNSLQDHTSRGVLG